MKKMEEIRIMNLDEAKILYQALHHWYFRHQLRKLSKPDLLKIDKLYQDLKRFLTESEEER